jgi:hypothetical protein
MAQTTSDNTLTIILCVLGAIAVYYLFFDTSSCSAGSKENYTRSKPVVKRRAPTVERKRTAPTPAPAKKDALQQKDNTAAADYLKKKMEESAKPLLSSELLPKEADGWDKYGCYTPEYDPMLSYNRLAPHVENPQKNKDLQLGRTVYAIKKNDSISPWNNSTISRQTRALDEDMLLNPDPDVVVVTPRV